MTLAHSLIDAGHRLEEIVVREKEVVSGGLTADDASIRWSNGAVWRRTSGT
ncbi:MAG: hypothetical protein WA159_05915 [Variovorax sp.]